MLKSALLSCKALMMLVAAQTSDPVTEEEDMKANCARREQIVDSSDSRVSPRTQIRNGAYFVDDQEIRITDDEEALNCEFDSGGGRIDELPIEMVGNTVPNKTGGKP